MFELCTQVKFEPGAPLFAVHTECLTSDGSTCRVSVGNIFKAENIKASQQTARHMSCAIWGFSCCMNCRGCDRQPVANPSNSMRPLIKQFSDAWRPAVLRVHGSSY